MSKEKSEHQQELEAELDKRSTKEALIMFPIIILLIVAMLFPDTPELTLGALLGIAGMFALGALIGLG